MSTQEIRTRDAVPVFSRISWGALLAGLFVTLAVFVLLSALGVAIGLSSADASGREAVTIGGGVWAVATALAAFFCGGCVVSRFTAGESKTEAVVYGTVLWGAAFALILWATGSVLRTGSTLAVGSAQVAVTGPQGPPSWEQAARRAGATDAQINQMRADLPTAERVQDISAQAAWWSFAGVLLSLLAAIGGSVLGAGPNPAFGGVLFRRTDPVPGV
ncbi:MAG TPA: hypothetical protein VGE74_16460 [Gemmata sp.]